MTEPHPRVAADTWILGTWQLLRADAAVELQPGARMHFGADQRLEYTIPGPEGVFCVTLVWRVDGGARLRTHLEDGTNPVEVEVYVDAHDVMTLDFGGPRAWFVRAG